MTTDHTTAETVPAQDAARAPVVQPRVEPSPKVTGAAPETTAKQPEGQAAEATDADRRTKNEKSRRKGTSSRGRRRCSNSSSTRTKSQRRNST